MEHLGRGTAEHVDIMIVVTDANRKSLDIAKNICTIAAKSNIANIGLVGNRITGLKEEEAIRSFAARNQFRLFALIPFDQQVADAGITGSAVEETSSCAFTEIRRLANQLMKTGDAYYTTNG
jgi:CO dehydrogenase maturation factor